MILFFKKIAGGILRTTAMLLLGFIVTTVGLFIFIQENVFSLYLLSIVCTGGVGLALWVPLWLGVGKGSMKLFSMFFSHKSSDTTVLVSSDAPSVKPTVHQLAVINYITQARTANLSDQSIHSNLYGAGWTPDDINFGFEAVGGKK